MVTSDKLVLKAEPATEVPTLECSVSFVIKIKVQERKRNSSTSEGNRSLRIKSPHYGESRGGAGGLLSREKAEDASSRGPPLLGGVVRGRNPLGGGLRYEGREELPRSYTQITQTPPTSTFQNSLEYTSQNKARPKVSISSKFLSKMWVYVFPHK